ncbi:MAG: sigma-70 family RNA polymerase sigma factor [Bacteroidota bacterium]
MSSSTPGERISDSAMHAEWQEVQAAQADPRAFRPLYERYYEPIFRFVLHRCKDEAMAADLCSQVFLKALNKLGSYEYRGLPFSAWLYRIAANEVTMYYRQQKRQRVVSADTSLYHELVDTSSLPAEEVDQESMEYALRQVLQSLKPEELSIIELRFFEQRPFAEIAEILDITEANAKMRTYRILGRLRKKMPQQE